MFRTAAAGAAAFLVVCLRPSSEAWVAFPSAKREASLVSTRSADVSSEARRGLIGAGLVAAFGGLPDAAVASGGSTAGKYSTIPSAKRRFYGRVRQGIYQFLSMEEPLKAGQLQDPRISDFFAKTIIKIKGGQTEQGCAIDLGWCTTKEKRTSRWNDMKVASDLLASGFRYSAEDRNDLLPQVRLIRKFAKKVDKIQLAVDAGEAQEAQDLFASAKLDLNKYLPYVELSPLDSEDYTHEWDTRPQVLCQGTFCV